MKAANKGQFYLIGDTHVNRSKPHKSAPALMEAHLQLHLMTNIMKKNG